MGQRGEWNVRERAISEYASVVYIINAVYKKRKSKLSGKHMYLTFIMQCIFLLKEHGRIKWHKRQITNS